MTPIFLFRDTIQGYTTKLKGLGVAAGKKNFFWGPPLPDSMELDKAIRSGAVFPAVVLEYPDNAADDNNRTGFVETINFGLSVIDVHHARSEQNDVDALIYERCKPLVDQLIAKLRVDMAKNLIGECGYKLTLVNNLNGGWLGPIAQNAYGYRYNLEIRVIGKVLAYDPEMWDS